MISASRKMLPYRLGALIGKYGVEYQWETDLRGVDGGRQIEVDALGREIRPIRSVESFPGNNLVLTIDLELQRVAEEAFQDKNGVLIAMDPRNGRILAMVSKPSFDPDLFARNISAEEWKALMEHPFPSSSEQGDSGTVSSGIGLQNHHRPRRSRIRGPHPQHLVSLFGGLSLWEPGFPVLERRGAWSNQPPKGPCRVL